MWNKKDLMLAIPFYDSFIYQNNFKYEANFMHDLTAYDPVFFIEDNHLPVDLLLKQAVEEFASANNFNTQKVKSIYYRNRKDLTAFQTYKMITNRSFGRRASIHAPNLDGCGSEDTHHDSNPTNRAQEVQSNPANPAVKSYKLASLSRLNL